MQFAMPQTIKGKLTSVVVAILISVIGFAIIFQRSFAELATLDSASLDILQSQTSILMLRRHEKDFMARHDAKYLDKFIQDYSQLTRQLNDARDKLVVVDMNGETVVAATLSSLRKYQQDFNALVEKRMVIGTDKDNGLLEDVRAASHRIETDVKEIFNNDIYSNLLLLRRHEKDFLLRSESKYIDRFNEQIKAIQTVIDGSGVPLEKQLGMNADLEDYQYKFNALAGNLKEYGLTQSSGLHGSLRASVREAEKQMETLSSELLSGIDAREAALTLRLSLVGSVLALLLCSILWLISRAITNKVEVANNLMKKIAEGDSSLKVRMELKGNDELSELAGHFNRFIANLQATMEKIVGISTELSNNAEQSLTMAKDTSSNAEKQRLESESVSAAINEMTATGREIAQSVVTAAKIAQELQASARGGQEVNSESSRQIANLDDSMRVASVNIDKLNAESTRIGSVIDVIRNITEQTNLLALNAAIEAARAGEQGRGFAVVADQVRELALKTHESTDEITQIIGQLRTDVGLSVSLITDSSALAKSCVAKAHDGAESMAAILAQIENIAQQNMAIATASKEQTAMTDSVQSNILVISELAENTAVAAQQSSESTNSIEHLASQLNRLVGKFTGQQGAS
ncbi:methyl-accepting chemotaxis protein [Shewanella sp. NIFS-20-20]|uniref:methyl-accepting chemotaxis protein n=1 Tax=Shewanella sp. NIFS-20-20 TaxID=2853806 RepID=UPI001C478A4C|nr:methyl-accepting chemotaxis protein [Shewanella sp. NIFS-20-20]MBV7316096.1 methyl-accepting chemotaxis protein [Shewanella sp. NIFS-20-20]